MVELIVDGQKMDLPEDVQIKRTLQVHDIADVSSVNASHTNSFKLPKSPNNTQVLQGLGLFGDTSLIPYRKTQSNLLEDGFPLISLGWLDIKNTNDSYNVSIRDGIIDFFKAIENKKMGQDVPLPELNHTKNVQTVIDSLDSEYYRYLVNDYGGQVRAEPTSNINIDYLVPSARMKYLWEQIFKTFNFTFSGQIFSDENFNNAWLTYPKSNSEIIQTDIADFEKNSKPEQTRWVFLNGQYELLGLFSNLSWSAITIHESGVVNTTPINNRLWRINLLETSNYLFNVEFNAETVYPIKIISNPRPTLYITAPFKIELYWNDGFIGSVLSDGSEGSFPFPANAGDNVRFRMVALSQIELWAWLEENAENPPPPIDQHIMGAPEGWEWGDLKVEVKQIEFGTTDFENVFKDWSVTEFVKDVMQRFGLTPIIDNHNRHITFYTIDEMLSKDGFIDWSEKYVSRKDEIYEFNNYAQQNKFIHKYTEAEKIYADGVLNVFNQNISESKNLVSSKYFAPEEFPIFIDFFGGGITNFPTLVWTKEVDVDDDGEVIVNYKGQTGRWFWLKSKRDNRTVGFTSLNLGESQTASAFNVADTSYTVFSELVPIYYSGYQQILNNSRIHTMELALTAVDVIKPDFTKLYYFEQEQSFYKLNRINYEKGKISTGEFIKINRP